MNNEERIAQRVKKLKEDARAGGYILNPDEELVQSLAAGMLQNKDRYGIESCPCRLFRGSAEDNIDIICPCDYRDDDLAEHGACFCALYVADPYTSEVKQVPERRPPVSERKNRASIKTTEPQGIGNLAYPVYRCSVCGYLCAKDNPPNVCPICKAGSERFERFI